LMTNYCELDCKFCINRRSSDVMRARFTVTELTTLVLDFYRRNYIEGLFLSSGILRSPDYTMEQLVGVAQRLREQHEFKGYIHLKAIPGASEELLHQAGRYADRLSLNIELATDEGLAQLAPEKDAAGIENSMARIQRGIAENRDDRKRLKSTPRFAPAGQSTQLIVGAEAASDAVILARSANLYAVRQLRRVYYSAFSPIDVPSDELPRSPAPLMREHRLYQADWLMRFYGFSHAEISAAAPGGMLSLTMDPKLAWALSHPEAFPVDLNRAPFEQLVRVPGLGVRAAKKLVAMRRSQRLRLEHLAKASRSLSRSKSFVVAADWSPRSPPPPSTWMRQREATGQLALRFE
jgi:putative DNA modification/repair radical SAM protein